MRPISNDTTATILIIDPNNNRISQFINIPFEDGIIDNLSLELNERPSLGTWSIKVTINKSNKDIINNFLVEEYVLPKFIINTETPEYILRTDKMLQGTIEAKYTYGKYISGEAVIELLDESFFYTTFLKSEYKIKSVKSVKLNSENGKVKFKFDLNFRIDAYRIFLNVTVIDKITREINVKLIEINVYESDLVVMVDPHYFEPNKLNKINV